MLLIVDANVLIDYLLTDETILTASARYIGEIHILHEVIDEVDQLDEAHCNKLGLIIVEPTVEQLVEAGRDAGPLAFSDRLCLILARDRGWICLTNDRPLHRACEAVGVVSMWGLELMLELVESGHMRPVDALRNAEQIRENSGGRLSDKIMERFFNEVAVRGKKHR